MKRFSLVCLLIITTAILFVGCTGEQGPVGPTGATGATGATGETGVPGPEAAYYDFSIVFGPSTTYGSFLLTSTIFDGDDAVIVYWKEPVSTTYWLVQIPYVWYETPTSAGVSFWPEVASVTLFVNTTLADGSTGSPWAITNTQYFRTVIIKASAGKSIPEIDYNDYKAVKEYFNFDN
jgi:hypothetical protein